MSIFSGTYTTYTAIGNREDLIDMITNISPDVTPVLSMTGSVRALARTHEWQTDALSAPAANAQIEGDDVTAVTATTPTTRVTNQTQILRKVFAVTETQEVVDKAGRSSEINYQTTKELRELATDVEYAFVVNTAAVTGATGTARKLNGISGFITTNVSTGASGGRALTSAILDADLQAAWAAGGNPDTILCGGFQKRGFTNATNFPGLTRNINADQNKFINSVSVYESAFGMLQVKLSHVMNTNLAGTLYALEMKRWRKAWLRPIKRTELAKTGDARKFMIVAEVTLESLAENANSATKNLTTS